MSDVVLFVRNNIQLVLGLGILIARLGDVGSTYLATPTLRLEGNPLARRAGWWFALASLVLCAVPYVSVELGIVVLVPSLLVTASNLSKGWLMRALGEAGYEQFTMLAARQSSVRMALGFTLGSAAFFAAAGATLLVLSGGPSFASYWFAQGVLLYALAVAVYGSLSVSRLFKRVRG